MNSRIKKKLRKGSVLIYDVASLPDGLRMHELVFGFKNTGVVIFDSTKGTEPSIVPKHNKRAIKFIDSNKTK